MKTRMMRLLWTITLVIPIGIQAQNSIKGTVFNESGEPLPHAKITIVGTYNGAYTDEEGTFIIRKIENGSYSLRTSLLGYEEKEQSVEIKDADAIVKVSLTSSALMIEEMQVAGVRADQSTPTTFSNLNKEDIDKANYGQDIPYLLQTTPSTVVTSDAGGGVGYTSVRIRGVDPTRTNVTVNGIPLNDAESHGVWWVNMPDFASSSDNIQVQRGVGTSSNGAAAFGASINIKSDNIEREAYGVLDNSIGSFNTLRTTVKAGTGLLNQHFVMDARLSRIASDGFIDRASSNLRSFYLSGAYVGDKSIIKANVFSGKEKTYQAWWGIPQAKFNGDEEGLLTHYYNDGGYTYQTTQDSINLFDSGNNTYNYYTYDNEVDNYQQDHYQLHFTHAFNQKVSLNIAGHYTRGQGYYEQYRRNDDFATYGFEPVVTGGDTITSTDLIRRRWLDNHFYGGIFSVTYNSLKRLKLIVGGGANNYLGGHYGEVIWARYASNSEIRDRYYENDAQKFEFNGYVKANYQIKKLGLFADLQVRNINYNYLGMDESFGELVALEQNTTFTFFNPKAGLTFDLNSNSTLYASLAVAHREPMRGDFVESSPTSRPRPEQLQDTELGYRFEFKKLRGNANGYFMNYKDQLILTGQINDVGGYTRTNVAKSYRAGVEFEMAYLILKNLSVSANAMFSQNKINSFTEYVDNYETWLQEEIVHKNTDLAFSPNFIAGLGLNYEPVKNLNLSIFGKQVGEQYLDNTSSDDRKLDAYTTFNLKVDYAIENVLFKEIRFGILVNNLFDYSYANNGYTWGYIYGGQRVVENFVYPLAGRNYLARLTLSF